MTPEKQPENDSSVSIIIPVCDEAGNLPALFDRIPKFAQSIELIFVEGHSKDQSNQVLVEQIIHHPEWDCRLFKQYGKGKSDAVFYGLDHAVGDVLIIFDADLSVDPEELPNFYRAILQGSGDLIIGNRFRHQVSENAMPRINLLANKLFAWWISRLIKQRIMDSLCGLKALRRSHYRLIRETQFANIHHDPFGDFYLLLGAAKLKLEIIQRPVHYHERQYGISKIHPVRDGLKLLRFIFKAVLQDWK